MFVKVLAQYVAHRSVQSMSPTGLLLLLHCNDLEEQSPIKMQCKKHKTKNAL